MISSSSFNVRMKSLDKIKNKLAKRQASPSPDVVSGDAEASRYGLLPVNQKSESDEYPVDIIAVHGLNGSPFSTWRHSNGTMWLQDLLPNFLPGSRIFTYGYPSRVFSSSMARIQESSRNLLSSIRDVQDRSPSKRPIVFICHSLGGIVFKQALVFAHEDRSTHGSTLESIIGVVFLGTPHGGSDMANSASPAGFVANILPLAFSQPPVVRTDLLSQLKQNAPALHDLTLSALHRLRDISVSSFYETEPTPISPLIVDRTSGVLGLSHEHAVPLFEDHRTICKFPGETESYKAIAQSLKRIILGHLDKTTGPASPTRSEQSFTADEKACMALFNVFDVQDYKRLLPRVIPGTCDWLLADSTYNSWVESQENAVLWLAGYPGSGKTMLSLFMAQHLGTNTLVYFCDNKITQQKDANFILMGLISQLVHHRRSLIRHIRKAYQLRGPSMVQSFSALWGVFVAMVHDAESGCLYVVLDALDECEHVTRRHLLEAICELVNESDADSQIKFLVTSRPIQDMCSDPSLTNYKLSIDSSEPAYAESLQRFIEERVDQLARQRHFSTDVRNFISDSLTSRADHSFLWVHMALSSMDNSHLTAKRDLERIVSTIPSNLEATYFKFLSEIPSEHATIAFKLLRLLVASTRPLRLEEINTSFTVLATHSTANEVSGDSQAAIDHTMQAILGPMIRISDQKVTLVHQTAKEFLQAHAHDFSLTTTGEYCALEMAYACIWYLLLGDFAGDIYQADPSPSLTESVSSDESLAIGLWDDGEDLQIDIFPETGVPDEDACKRVVSGYSFYEYASLNWARHLSQCEAIASLELRDAAKALLDTSRGECRNWLQFHWADPTTHLDHDPTNFSPLALASYFNLHQTVQDLLNHKTFDSSAKDQALIWASMNGHLEPLKLLLDSGANPNYKHPGLSTTALTAAAEHGQLDCVKALLSDARTDPNMPGGNNKGALSFACVNGYESIVDLFLGHPNHHVEESDTSQTTPFIWACHGGHLSLVVKLARQGVDINHKDRDGRTALSWAAGEGMQDVVKCLLSLADIHVNSTDNTGKTALVWAAGENKVQVVKTLLKNKQVDRGILDRDQRGPISWAAAGGHADVLRNLVKHGCSGLRDKDIDGWTPLAWAIQNDAPEAVDVLISEGHIDLQKEDLEEQSLGSRTVLSWAVEYGHERVVTRLLEKGADPHARRANGDTPLSIARKFDRPDLVELLTKGSNEW
ncbi:hypothetical protein F66182_9012 [Fusarium sp. NRRL 66182]|nr:hypothetical protein F66182_9012 [Fusarium sp. NRRL 66182]